jgi:polyisoprenoid-binding protein YceI
MFKTTIPWSLGLLLWLSAPSPGEQGLKFSIQPDESSFIVKVGRAGLLKLLGHDHVVEVQRYSGEVSWSPDSAETSSLILEIEAASLTVLDEGIKEEERAEIQAVMETKVLEVDEYPDIRFESTKMRLQGTGGGAYRATLSGALTLHGVTGAIDIPFQLTVSDGRLRARGSLKIKGSRFGIEPIRVAGGTVKTKDELELIFDLIGSSY